MSPLSVPNFSLIGARIRVLWWILRSVQKVEEKMKKKPQTLAACISEMAGVIFFTFGMWAPLPSRHFCSKFGVNRIRDHSRCGMPASWAARHVCLDIENFMCITLKTRVNNSIYSKSKIQ